MSLLGIDIGTTGTKAIAFNEDGNIITTSYSEYDFVFPKPGWVEFDVTSMWEKIFNVIQKINSSEKVKKDPVTALSVSTIGESFTPIDKKGNTLYNTIYSTDTRSVKELEYIFTKISAKDLYSITGLTPSFITALNKILWIKNNLPSIYLKTKKILFTEDLLFHKLGIIDTKIDYSLCSRTLFFDIRTKKWSSKILDECDLDINLFSEPYPSGCEIGYVNNEIAKLLGFKKKVSVVTGGHDQPCAALGVGAIEKGIASDGMGTVECIATATDKLIINNKLLRNGFPIQIHVVNNMYITQIGILSAGSVVKWYRDVLAYKEMQEAKEKSSNVYDIIFSKLNFKPSGLYLLPYFSASGSPYWDPVPRGTICGLSLTTKKEDIFQAIIEGLVFEVALNIELLEEAGVVIKELRAVGGSAKRDYWLKLKSSILNKSIKQMDITEAGCLATMILAGKGTGKFSIEEAINKLVKVNKVFYPEEEIRDKYMESFEKYKKIYGFASKL
jgi:xylulokinase